MHDIAQGYSKGVRPAVEIAVCQITPNQNPLAKSSQARTWMPFAEAPNSHNQSPKWTGNTVSWAPKTGTAPSDAPGGDQGNLKGPLFGGSPTKAPGRSHARSPPENPRRPSAAFAHPVDISVEARRRRPTRCTPAIAGGRQPRQGAVDTVTRTGKSTWGGYEPGGPWAQQRPAAAPSGPARWRLASASGEKPARHRC